MKPYFENQKPSHCGCYYPDSWRLGDDGKGNRLMFCLRHGFTLFKIRRNKLNPEHHPLDLNQLPTEADREKQRKRIMKAKV
jgi:hypothetical protein